MINAAFTEPSRPNPESTGEMPSRITLTRSAHTFCLLLLLLWFVACSVSLVVIKECNFLFFLPPPFTENKTSFETIPRGTISDRVERT